MAFKEGRAKEGAGATKRDVARYMNQQKQKEEPLNNAFAAALAGLSFGDSREASQNPAEHKGGKRGVTAKRKG